MEFKISVVLKNGKHAAFDPEEFLNDKEFTFYNSLSGHVKTDWASGRAALKQAFGEYRGISKPLQDVEVINKANGQPYIKDHEGHFCSIAHSNNYGIGVVASRRVGVDIERVRLRPRSSLPYIAQDDEIGIINRDFGSTEGQITLLWTIKEAVMKGLGIGLGMSPKSIRIHGRNKKGIFSVSARQNAATTRWSVQSVRLNGFFISIALLQWSRQMK